MQDVAAVAARVEATPTDRDFLPQERLDLDARGGRTSIYPWRGQFSPGLIELLIQTHAQPGCRVLDPFVGSGTTLFEAGRVGLSSSGVEVNPAAYLFASMARFMNEDEVARSSVASLAEELLARALHGLVQPSLLAQPHGETDRATFTERITRVLADARQKDELAELLLATSVLLGMGAGDSLAPENLLAAFNRNTAKMLRLPFTESECSVQLGDARRLPARDETVDLVITSPPYINVFNYHQNYRKAAELIGWRPLHVAPSEIGANRKHRSNRFLTVIQYCLDHAQVFMELRRVLSVNGEILFVIGRGSTVRGVAFNNGLLLATVATGGCGLTLRRWQERKFKTRFGETIFEEVLTFGHDGHPADSPELFARQVGAWALEQALRLSSSDSKPGVRSDMEQALERCAQVSPSPFLDAGGARAGN